MDTNFLSRGFTDILYVSFNDELKNLQKLIYEYTKNYLVDHDQSLSIEKKINLHFKEKPSDTIWSELMGQINNSEELKKIINSRSIANTFKVIFKNPKPFKISTFRARFPEQKRVFYNWHQDEGTWYLSKNKDVQNKLPATLWLSLNGANKDDSIQLIKFSHKKKLFNHEYVTGQGFFNINKKNFISEKHIFTVETNPSECIIFHPLTVHRSVPSTELNLRPRYTIDIRYYDENINFNIDVETTFKIRKLLGKIF